MTTAKIEVLLPIEVVDKRGDLVPKFLECSVPLIYGHNFERLVPARL
jgi:hypothetical protein